MNLTRHHVTIPRTARYCLLGEPGPAVREVWYALHGYGQLAAEFAARLSALADPARLVVVPEALSRFYIVRHDGASPAAHQEARVGASWMTREDRDAEIADYVGYLDALHAEVGRSLPAGTPVTVLGFSQGVATAVRWVCLGAARAERLIAWAGTLPGELTPAQLARLAALRVVFVTGERDAVIPAAGSEQEAARLRGAGGTVELRRFAGGHRLDDDLLRALAAPAPSGTRADRATS